MLQRARIKQLLCELALKDYAAAETTLKKIRPTATNDDWRSMIPDLYSLFSDNKFIDHDKTYLSILNELCTSCLQSAK
ncbi:hypothetical protein ABTJ74_19915, partial [Acinetobacter baumannii]